MDEIEHARDDDLSGRGDIYKKGKEINGAINNVEVIRKKKTYARKKNESYSAGLEENNLSDKMSEARDNKNKSISALRKSMSRATAQGLNALTRSVVEEQFVPREHYFALLMQNFELIDVKFRTAVEVAAHNSLFHVIVDTDETAAKLMHRLEKDRLGRVTFLPLNQLRA